MDKMAGRKTLVPLTLADLLCRRIAASGSPQAMNDLALKFGTYLSTERNFAGLTRAQLSKQSGVSEIEIYALEHGLVPPAEIDHQSLLRIAQAFNDDIELYARMLKQTIGADGAPQLADHHLAGKAHQRPCILVIDHEEPLRNLLCISLQKAGYTVYTAGNRNEAMDVFEQSPIDLVLLDVLMPDMDGFALCAELRKRSDMPIIMLSALSRDDMIHGFTLGADDYIAKPFQFRDVEVRIQAILRRVAWLKGRPDFHILSCGDIVLDGEAHEVRVRGELVHLTPIEFQLLRYLMRTPDKPISKKELFQAVWGYDLVEDTHLVDVAIRHLREKIEETPAEPVYLLSVQDDNYKFSTQPVDPRARNHKNETDLWRTGQADPV